MQLAQHGRLVLDGQALLGGLEMGITGAAPPDVALRVLPFGMIGIPESNVRRAEATPRRLRALLRALCLREGESGRVAVSLDFGVM